MVGVCVPLVDLTNPKLFAVASAYPTSEFWEPCHSVIGTVANIARRSELFSMLPTPTVVEPMVSANSMMVDPSLHSAEYCKPPVGLKA